jgi:UDP-N-acetylmuramate--alanine ligase
VTAEVLAARIAEASRRPVRYAPSFTDAVDAVSATAEPGDMVLTLGAGSVSQLGPLILEKLERTPTPQLS